MNSHTFGGGGETWIVSQKDRVQGLLRVEKRKVLSRNSGEDAAEERCSS